MKKPLGIYLIVVYFLFGILGSVQSISQITDPNFPSIPLFGMISVPKTVNLLFTLIGVIVSVACAYGVYKAKKWGFTLTVALFALGIASVLLTIPKIDSINKTFMEYLITSGQVPEGTEAFVMETVRLGMLFGLALTVILSAIIIIYLIKKKEYFTED